jgi:hypothetical protein
MALFIIEKIAEISVKKIIIHNTITNAKAALKKMKAFRMNNKN